MMTAINKANCRIMGGPTREHFEKSTWRLQTCQVPRGQATCCSVARYKLVFTSHELGFTDRQQRVTLERIYLHSRCRQLVLKPHTTLMLFLENL